MPDNSDLIGTIALNFRDELRVDISRYRGHGYINVRVWVRSVDGTMKPTVRGIICEITRLRPLRRLLRHANRRALKQGLLPPRGRK
jgi:hypothetical protein